MVKKYKSKSTAKRWGKYYMKKWSHVIDFVVHPHPTDFGFAIFITIPAKRNPLDTLCIPVGS